MSDSEGGLPSETAIYSKLRHVVVAIHKSGNTDDLTVKRVRARTEKELGLDEGFFKTHPSWKQKSQDAIVEAVDKYCHEEPTPKKTTAKPKPKPVEKKAKAASESARGVKRKTTAPAKKPKKRRKAASEDESEIESSELPERSDADSDLPNKPIRRGKKVVAEDSDEEEEAQQAKTKAKAALDDDQSDAEPIAPVKKLRNTPPPEPMGDVSDSELSELIDESPVKKPRRKKELQTKTTEKAPSKSKTAPAKSKANDDPDEAEVKRLQGWLVKCGIRKIWSKDPELSKCDTTKEKIKVLKNMLKEAGMDGKYSNEKAAKIKEQREFAKDLAAIQEGELAWGKAIEVTATGRPSRRAAAKPVPQQKGVLSDDSEEDEANGGNDDKESSDEDDDDDDDDVHGESGDDDDEKDDDSGDDDSD
ncbi:Nn.00g004980.m01.CDS01 [Neocucurbitaria sp. VM-36]